MCGIVGFITNETKTREKDRAKFLRQALIIDTLRGDDSTGAFAVGHEPLYKDGSTYWYKQLGDGYDFVNADEYWTNFFDVTAYKSVVGHNRAATVGGVDVESAHPFVVGPITMVHNGTLTTTHNLPDPMSSIRLEDGKKVTVDSHAVAWNLAHHDAEDVISRINGAFALVWHDARDDSINIVRNTQRPLHLCRAKDEKTVYFMSEAQMLAMLMDRINIRTSAIIYPKSGQWLKFRSDGDIDHPEVKEIDLYSASYSRYGGYAWDDDDDYGPAWNTGSHSKAMSGEVIPMGKPQGDNKLFLGGRKKEIPMRLQEELLRHDLLVEDRLPFLTQSSERKGDTFLSRGRLDGKYQALVVTGSDNIATILKRSSKSPVTVRPLAVTVTPQGETIIIAKYVSATFTPESGKAENDDDPKESDSLELDRIREEEEPVRGPNGTWISRDEFRRRTAEGCSVCTSPIDVEEHHDIMWSVDGYDVLCPYCDDESWIAMERRYH